MTPGSSRINNSLYELANIDRDRYTILAFDLRTEGPVTATVFAVDGLSTGSH
jgi:hypothetical protein